MKTIYTLIFTICTLSLSAQSIKGTFSDENKKPLEFATITLHNFKDSTLVKGEITDANGLVEFRGIEDQTYFILCEYIGYESYKSKPIEFKNINIDLGEIFLSTSTQTLSEVTIKARKPLIEIKADKTILNTDASLTAAGSNGLELLRKAPGVVVDNNENIQLKGKNGVRIYIDGKPSYLNDKELANLLKSLTSADIEAIEIITNPSAKYDAQGNAGIINLRLRKNKNFGTNGSLNANVGYGKYHKSYVGVNLNNRNQKVNTFGSIGIGNNENYNLLELYREQDGSIYDQKSESRNVRNPLNGKFGIDYFLSDKHTLGFLANVGTNFKQNQDNEVSTTNISSSYNKLDSILKAENIQKKNSLNTNLNLNYKYSDTLGNELTVDIDRGFFNSTSTASQPNRYLDPTNLSLRTSRTVELVTPSKIMINTAKIDYTKELKSLGLTLGFGGKYANVKSDNTFDFFNIRSEQKSKDINQSNNFIYTENVAALYTNINGKLSSKLNYQIGLRMENTKSIGDLKRDVSLPTKQEDFVTKSYTDVFPSGALTYTLNDKNAFNLTYSRRIDRPSYEDLNPFEYRLNELTFRRGNPRLTPQYNNNIEFTYTAMQSASVSFSYNKSVDVITDIVERDLASTGRSFINYRNLASQENYAMTISSPLPIKSWWNGYFSATLYKAFYKARFPEYTFDAQTPIATNIYVENSFSLPKDFSAEISGWYNSASIWGGSWLTEPQGSLDLGISKKILNNKGTLKLSVTDLLMTAQWASYSDAIPGLKIRGGGNWESQQVKLNFSYRFGSNQVKSARNRKTGLESENSRIKG